MDCKLKLHGEGIIISLVALREDITVKPHLLYWQNYTGWGFLDSMASKLSLETVLVWAGVSCVGTQLVSATYRTCHNWLPRYVSVLSDVEVDAGPPSTHYMHHNTTTNVLHKTAQQNCFPFSCTRQLVT